MITNFIDTNSKRIILLYMFAQSIVNIATLIWLYHNAFIFFPAL